MGLSLRGSTSGSIDINPPAVAGNNTITLPGDNGSANQFFRNSTIAGIVTYSSMVEDSSGNIGIGSETPGASLDIAKTTPVIRFTDTDAGQYAELLNSGSSFYISADRGNGGNGDIIFRSGGTSEKLRITSGGNVGIGTDSPGAKLHIDSTTTNTPLVVEASQNNRSRLVFRNNQETGTQCTVELIDEDLRFNTNSGERMRIVKDGNIGIGLTNPSAKLEVYLGTNVAGTIARFGGYNDGRSLIFSNSGVGADHFINAQASGGSITFQTGSIDRAKIANGGIINLNGQRSGFSTPMSGSGNVRIAAASAGGIALSTFDTNNYTAVQFVREVSGTAQQVGTITCNTTNTAYNTSSDYRLKENVVPLTGAADRLSQLPVHRFNFIADPSKTVDGFLAHEAQDVVPECVTGTKDEVDDEGNPVYQGIDQSKLVPLLTAALQEAMERIETLEAKVTALEGA